MEDYLQAEYRDVREAYAKTMWLPRSNDMAVDFVYAVVASHFRQTPYDLAWGCIVGQAAGGKSETLKPLKTRTDMVVSVDQVSGQALMSGWTPDGDVDPDKDPSLLKKLDGKIMLMTDLTTTFAMPATEQGKFWGVLRKAFDGEASSAFGHTGVRHYEARFAFLAACTPALYRLMQTEAAMGQRLLFFRLRPPANFDETMDDMRQIERLKIASEYERRRQRVEAFLPRLRTYVEGLGPDHRLDRNVDDVTRLAYMTVNLRAVGTSSGPVDVEQPTRVKAQLLQLGDARAILYGREAWDSSDYAFVARIARDTMQPIVLHTARLVALAMRSGNGIEEQKLRRMMGKFMSSKVASRVLQQLLSVDFIVNSEGRFTMSKENQGLMKQTNLVGAGG